MDGLALLMRTHKQEREQEQAPVLALDHPETPLAVAHPGSV